MHAKFEAERKAGRTLKTHLDKDDKEGFAYISTCAHYQAIFFNQPRDKEKVKIVARAADKTIEAMEIEKHIVTYQHHHENMFDEDEDKETAKVAKALLKQYVSMVKDYAQRDELKDKPIATHQ